MVALDSARFPRLAAYVRSLPQGLASHPDSKARGALVRSVVECDPLADVPENALPPEVRGLITTPPLNTQWIPDAVYFGALFALADYRHISEARLDEWLREANQRLFKNPVYRMLISLASPGVLLTLSSSTWGTMHRGTTFKVLSSDKQSGVAELSFPERLYDRNAIKSIGIGIEVALEHANVRSASVTTTAMTSTSARFETRWD